MCGTGTLACAPVSSEAANTGKSAGATRAWVSAVIRFVLNVFTFLARCDILKEVWQ